MLPRQQKCVAVGVLMTIINTRHVLCFSSFRTVTDISKALLAISGNCCVAYVSSWRFPQRNAFAKEMYCVNPVGYILTIC